MWFICLGLLVFIAYTIHIVRYTRRLLWKDLEVFNEIDPAIEERFKPFQRIDKLKWNTMEIYFCAIFLFPIRLFVILSSLLFLLACIHIIGGGSDDTSYLKEFSLKKRNAIKFVHRAVSRIILFSCGFHTIQRRQLRLADYDDSAAAKKSSGKKAGSNTLAPIVVSNHTSWLDIIYHISSTEAPSFLSKIEVKSFPIIGKAAKLLQSIFVDRSNEANRGAVCAALKERGEFIQAGQNFPPIVIFPEGTAANGRYLISFKKGAFEPHIPMKIVLIEYPRQNLDINLDYIGQLANSFLILCQFKNNIRITEFDQDFDPSSIVLPKDSKLELWELYANRVKSIMLKALPNVQNSESGFRDLKNYEEILKKKKLELIEKRTKHDKKQ